MFELKFLPDALSLCSSMGIIFFMSPCYSLHSFATLYTLRTTSLSGRGGSDEVSRTLDYGFADFSTAEALLHLRDKFTKEGVF